MIFSIIFVLKYCEEEEEEEEERALFDTVVNSFIIHSLLKAFKHKCCVISLLYTIIITKVNSIVG